MTARMYRHAPVVEAFRFGHDHPPEWMSHSTGVVVAWDGTREWVRVRTRTGEVKAFKGDWIVRDADGGVDVVYHGAFKRDYKETR